MSCNKFACTCTVRRKNTCMPSNIFYDTSKVHFTSDYIYTGLRSLVLLLILMLTGVDVLTPDAPRLVIAFSSEITYCVGLPKGNLHCSGPVQKQSTEVSPTLPLSHVGSVTFYLSFTARFKRQHWSTAIILVRYIFPAIPSNISALNTLRWIFISFAKKWLVVKFMSFMFLPDIRLSTSSPKDFRAYYLMIFEPVLVFVNLPLRLRGVIEYFPNILSLIVYLLF
ncbi:hypothetical protein K7X08_001223 [Anisodus acutangulus]|uniref:Uncharacterized protein n=1 Tax=Anisodus acutangulus TaxID=402998 RepID=A0A9Q1MRL9_9SOLA|nr:hypothetical protein K7X08_001223 [Anisodus acutangulus]